MGGMFGSWDSVGSKRATVCNPTLHHYDLERIPTKALVAELVKRPQVKVDPSSSMIPENQSLDITKAPISPPVDPNPKLRLIIEGEFDEIS